MSRIYLLGPGYWYTLKLRLLFTTPTCQAIIITRTSLTIQSTALLVTNVAAFCFRSIILSLLTLLLAPMVNKDTILNFRRPRPQNPKPRPYPDSPPPVSNENSPTISVENLSGSNQDLDSPFAKKVKWFFCFPLVHSGSRRSPPHWSLSLSLSPTTFHTILYLILLTLCYDYCPTLLLFLSSLLSL